MGWLIAYVRLTLVVSVLCSISEAVLLSIRRPYLQILRTERPKIAELLSGLLKFLDRQLAAIPSLKTIAHTVGAAGTGAQALGQTRQSPRDRSEHPVRIQNLV